MAGTARFLRRQATDRRAVKICNGCGSSVSLTLVGGNGRGGSIRDLPVADLYRIAAAGRVISCGSSPPTYSLVSAGFYFTSLHAPEVSSGPRQVQRVNNVNDVRRGAAALHRGRHALRRPKARCLVESTKSTPSLRYRNCTKRTIVMSRTFASRQG